MGALTPTPLGSGDADGARASEIQHAVERVDGDRHLGRPALIRVRAHTDERRASEVAVAVHALNRMLDLGRPSSVRVA